MDKNKIIATEVRKVFVGNPAIIHKILITLLAGGHALLEDIPGVGKTTLAVAFSKALGLSCKRMQFTPDVMPSDVIGFTMPNQLTGEMDYKPGAVMCNFFLADEINRASTRTQSALLEAMEEGNVTVDGTTYPLPDPFMVIATQNPAGSSGTQLLPESQTDRFMIRLSIGYPSPSAELEMLYRKHGNNPIPPINSVSDAAEILLMRKQVSAIYLHNEIYDYILRLCRATREHSSIARGASPRCTASLMTLAQAVAYTWQRDYVLPSDILFVFTDCLSHRILLSSEAKRNNLAIDDILNEIATATIAPQLT